MLDLQPIMMKNNIMAGAIFDFIFKNNVNGDTGKLQVLWDMF